MPKPLTPAPWWLQAQAALAAADPVMNLLIAQYPGEHLASRGDLFYTLVRAITGQQISALAAQAIWQRLEALAPIAPAPLLAVPDAALRDAGLSHRKIDYIKGLARSAGGLAETSWSTLDDPAIRKQLCRLRGVGPWTAEMALIFTFLRPDVLPFGDVGLVRTMERYYAGGRRLSPDALGRIAACWQPWRTAATWYLWRSLDPVPVAY